MNKTPACLVLVSILMVNTQAAEMEFLKLDSDMTQAVKVGSGVLIHTAQVFGRTAEEALDRVSAAIKESNSETAVLAKINVYGANQESIESARALIAKRYAQQMPAVSYVVGKLADPNSLIAMDGVAVADSGGLVGQRVARSSQASTLAPGSRVYVSGQAEKGASPGEAARLTLQSLRKTLDWLGCSLDDVVQVKSFLTPISACAEVRRELESAFGVGKVPPLVFVEWESPIPIEIELIAAAPQSALGDATQKKSDVSSARGTQSKSIEYLTPPGMTASPVYCRVAKVNSLRTIYVSGLYSARPGNGADEVTSVFEQLASILQKSGSDFVHLAKATYYVSSPDSSSKLNELRPKYYDSQRPPAASKAAVASVGMLQRTLTMDMIAVPTEK